MKNRGRISSSKMSIRGGLVDEKSIVEAATELINEIIMEDTRYERLLGI